MKIIESVILAVLLLNCDGFVGEIKVDAQDTASSAGKWYRLPTTSMEPTIRKEDQILVDEAAYETAAPKRGDIVAYRLPTNPKTTLVKRVVALPGETVQISRKRLSIDGRQAEEPYVVHNDENDYSGTTKPEPYKSRDSFGPYTLPEARFFVLGDNRDTSMDSRYHGPVPRELVVGKALKVAREGSIQDVR